MDLHFILTKDVQESVMKWKSDETITRTQRKIIIRTKKNASILQKVMNSHYTM